MMNERAPNSGWFIDFFLSWDSFSYHCQFKFIVFFDSTLLLSTWRLIPYHHFLTPLKIIGLYFCLDLIGIFTDLHIFFGQTICSFFVSWLWLEPLGKSWIDSLLSFCCTCFAAAAPAPVVTATVAAIVIAPDVVDVWWCCCNFDASFIWNGALCSVAICCGSAAITGCCVLPIIGTGTFAVILVWDWMFRDFNNGGFLIDAENANPRRKIALQITINKWKREQGEEEEEEREKQNWWRENAWLIGYKWKDKMN